MLPSDPDRNFCALFAPPAQRQALFVLHAFNQELARAQEIASEPALALIRLHWWREVVEGQPKRHVVATPLHALIASGALPSTAALAMIEARDDAVTDPPETPARFLAAMVAGPGALAVAAGALLGASAEEGAALRGLGSAYGVAGTMRNVPALARQGRSALPDGLLAAAGLTRAQALAHPDAVLDWCGAWMRPGGQALAGGRLRWRRAVLPAALPGVLARRDLARAQPVEARGLGDRLAVLRAAALGVV
jgi:phytoene synthase